MFGNVPSWNWASFGSVVVSPRVNTTRHTPVASCSTTFVSSSKSGSPVLGSFAGSPLASFRGMSFRSLNRTLVFSSFQTPFAWTSCWACFFNVPKPLAFMSVAPGVSFRQYQMLTGPPSTCAMGWPWAKWAFLSPIMNSSAAASAGSWVGSAYSSRKAICLVLCTPRTLMDLTVTCPMRFCQWTCGDIGNSVAGIVFQLGAIGSVGAELERSEEHTSELQSPCNLVCRLLLEKKKTD